MTSVAKIPPRLLLSLLFLFLLWLPLQSEAAGQGEALSAVQEGPGEILQGGPTDRVELEAFLDGVMEIQLREHNTAGAVVTVVKGGEVFFAKGYGYSDYEERVGVDPQRTLFRIGSVSKLFVWTSVMQLVEEGVLNLDTDINEYLPGFQIPERYDRPITLKDVMTHSAGFEEYIVGLFGTTEADRRPFAEILADQIPARVRPPGEVSSYSNHATGMAAAIVEAAAGMPWDQFVQERILDPLGMENISFAQPLPEGLAEHMSKGYSGRVNNFLEKDFEYVPLYPVGAASASGAAMAKFMMAHLHLGELGENRILQEETSRLMQSDLFTMAPGMNSALYGFYEMSSNGQRVIGHGGATFWFHTRLALFPEHDLGLFVSYNSAGGGAAAGEFLDAFVDRYFPVEEEVLTPPEDFGDRGERFTGPFRANRISHTSLAKVAALETVEVSLSADNTLKVFSREWIETAPLTFREKYGERTLHFREGEDGEITHMFQGGVPVVAFERIPFRDNYSLHGALFALFMIMMVSTFLALPLGWIARKWYGVRPEELERIPSRSRCALWWASALFVAFFVGLLITLAEPNIIAEEITLGLRITLLIPLLAAVFSAASVWFALQAFVKAQGRRLSRIFYSAAALSFCIFLWQLHVWNLLGWRF